MAEEFWSHSRSWEWYTPQKYVNAVRRVMGGIDLDPASCHIANRVVQAETYWTVEESKSGLAADWAGNVFLNPPYGREGKIVDGVMDYTKGRGNQATWTRYAIEQYEKGNVEQMILLVSAATSEVWFRPLWEYPICFTDHRIAFYGPDMEPVKGNTKGSAFVYFPPKGKYTNDPRRKGINLFFDHFIQFGAVSDSFIRGSYKSPDLETKRQRVLAGERGEDVLS